MIAGVAVRGGVAAGVALIVACAVALVEEQALEVEAESLERRLESRLDALDARLARISSNSKPSSTCAAGKAASTTTDGTRSGRC